MAQDVFSRLDLNLLKVLLILYQEQNMGKASERLFVTQPAVSQMLKKLRQHFDDPLFIKNKTGLIPTSYTENLIARIEPLMDSLSAELSEAESFSPELVHETIKLSVAPHLLRFLSAKLYLCLKSIAPKLQLEITSWDEKTREKLLKGEIHLGVNLTLENTPKELMQTELAEDQLTAYIRSGHPLDNGSTSHTLKELSQFEFASLIVPDWNAQQPLLEKLLILQGLPAIVGFRSSSTACILDVVQQTDLIYPASIFIVTEELQGLKAFQLKLEQQALSSDINAYYHQRNQRNPLTRWLIEHIQVLLAEAIGGAGSAI
ncbi:MAG: LysR family transcriptional regulator [Pseudomonadales bacterium]|nr:LysR family transcriptional regulator [Pseudomonadales bacterium]